jgi:hypothetical protein
MPSVEPCRSRIGWFSSVNCPDFCQSPAATETRYAGSERAAQRQDQREGVLGHSMHGIGLDVRDGDPAPFAGGEVHVVGAGRGHGDEAQVRQMVQHRLAERDLVHD